MDDSEALGALLDRCAIVDGRSPLSEFKTLRVPVANAFRSLVVPGPRDSVIALGVAAWHAAELGEAGGYWAAEMAIDPEQRSVDAYESILAALEEEVGFPLALWTFDAMQEAAAANHGMDEVRAILEMRRGLPADSVPLAAGFTVRSFAAGADESDWLVLNQRVFAHHPEAGAIDGADLALRMAQPWFDAAGLLLLFDGADAAGYCWTKLHDGELGEIYMIGLVPEYRGRNLARPLTSAGLDHLAATGATTAMLYAEASNLAAVGLYQSMGFQVVGRVVLHQRSAA